MDCRGGRDLYSKGGQISAVGGDRAVRSRTHGTAGALGRGSHTDSGGDEILCGGREGAGRRPGEYLGGAWDVSGSGGALEGAAGRLRRGPESSPDRGSVRL